MQPHLPSPPFQPPTAGTIVAISIMSVVLLVGNHILYGAAPSLHIQPFAMKALVSLQSSPLKKIHSLPLAFLCSFSSSQARLLTPTPFLSAPFKSKQKTHLVCLLAPFSPLSLSFSFTPFLFRLRVFFNCFYRCKSSTLLVGRAGWRSFVRGSTTQHKTVSRVQFPVNGDHCIPQLWVYKLPTDCILSWLCKDLTTFCASRISIEQKFSQHTVGLMLPTSLSIVVQLHQWNFGLVPDVLI